MSSRNTLCAALAAWIVWGAVPTAALADPQSNAAESSSTDTLEEVTVTAQRREQNLQNVPIAVTNFTAEQLASQQITTTEDLERMVPNMFAANNVGQASANVYYLRGLGQTQSFPTFEPQVGTYVDDIYIARQNANNFALFGVESVQVLNGPQGTLFGRNSTGGAIVVTLKKPGEEIGGDVEASYGSIGDFWADFFTGRASIDLPINQQLLTRTSVYGITNDGYVHDVSTGERLNSTHNWGVREALRFMPADWSNLEWNFSADYERNDDANLLNQPGPDGDRISYSGFSTTGGALKPYFTGKKADFGQGAVVTSWGFASNIALTWGQGTLNLITGYRGLNQQLAADFAAAVLGPLPTADAVPTGEITLAQILENHQVSQEVKWTDKIGDIFNYTAGVYYLYEQNRNNYGQVLGLGPTFALPLNDQYDVNSTKSEAVYAQGDLKITPAFTVTLGGRLTHEIKDVIAWPNSPGSGYTTEQIEAVGYPTHLDRHRVHTALGVAVPDRSGSDDVRIGDARLPGWWLEWPHGLESCGFQQLPTGNHLVIRDRVSLRVAREPLPLQHDVFLRGREGRSVALRQSAYRSVRHQQRRRHVWVWCRGQSRLACHGGPDVHRQYQLDARGFLQSLAADSNPAGSVPCRRGIELLRRHRHRGRLARGPGVHAGARFLRHRELFAEVSGIQLDADAVGSVRVA